MDYLKRLENLMARLRSRKGCPWDKKQTHKSLKPYLLEEAHEALDAIDSGDKDHLREELGDLLLQVVFHAQLAREKGNFDLQDVAKTIGDKLVRRHPHVFGKSSRKINDINRKWEELKLQEKPERKSALDGLPRSLPALHRAQRMFEKISKHSHPKDRLMVKNIKNALDDFKRELKGTKSSKEKAVGELLLKLSQFSFEEGIHAEMALKKTSLKFEQNYRRKENIKKTV